MSQQRIRKSLDCSGSYEARLQSIVSLTHLVRAEDRDCMKYNTAYNGTGIKLLVWFNVASTFPCGVNWMESVIVSRIT